MNSEIVGSDQEARKLEIKKGVLLTLLPVLSLFMMGLLAKLFPLPSPWPIKGFIGIVLISGFIVGFLGLRHMNRGRAGRFDGLGVVGLALLVAGSFLHFLFFGLSGLFWAVVSTGGPMFRG
jgi:hypothetical protein